jgi:hypothetical protein
MAIDPVEVICVAESGCLWYSRTHRVQANFEKRALSVHSQPMHIEYNRTAEAAVQKPAWNSTVQMSKKSVGSVRLNPSQLRLCELQAAPCCMLHNEPWCILHDTCRRRYRCQPYRA